MKRRRAIEADQIWTSTRLGTRTVVRRILSVVNARIFYSAEQSTTRSCEERAFRVWIKSYKAVKKQPARQSRLALEGGSGGPKRERSTTVRAKAARQPGATKC